MGGEKGNAGKVFDEMLQRADCNMNSSFRAFTRHCPCEHIAHTGCAAINEGKPRSEER
jgi:hypothetical protein